MKIQIQKKGFLLVLISVLLLWRRAESIRFDLESGHTKCISEDIKSNSMTVGKYLIVNPNDGHPLPDSHKITVRVTSAYGNSYHYSDHVTEGNFAFQAVEAGDYMACFFASDHTPGITITVDFDWKSGVAAKDWTSVAKKGSVECVMGKVTRTHHYIFGLHHSKEVGMKKYFLWLVHGKLQALKNFSAKRLLVLEKKNGCSNIY